MNGSGTAQTFTGAYSHTGGASGHYLAYMLFLPTPNVVNFIARGSCLVEYNRISNGMRLIDDAGTGWLGGQSGITIGQPGNTLRNASCTVNVGAASVSFVGNGLTVNVPVTFNGNFGPQLATFLQELDVNGVWTGMTQFGNWTTPTAMQPPLGPSIVSTTVQGAPATPTFTIVANGSGNTLPSQIHLRIGTSIVGAPVCHVVFTPSANAVALIDDTENALVDGGFFTIGINHNLTNSRCRFNAAGVLGFVGSFQATVAVPLSFTNFSGSKNVYVNVFDDQGRLTHWHSFSPVQIP